MYTPPKFRVDDGDRAVELIQRHPFATLIGWDGDDPIATHVPLLLKRPTPSSIVLLGHLARANPQAETLTEGRGRALAIFLGPHAYISAAWYSSASAPTWNYQAVHAYGHIEVVNGRVDLYNLLNDLVTHFESTKAEEERYRLETMPEDQLDNMMRAVVGFRLHVDRIEAVEKLSQNKTAEDYRNIIRGLENRADPASADVAREMRQSATSPSPSARPDGSSGSAGQ